MKLHRRQSQPTSPAEPIMAPSSPPANNAEPEKPQKRGGAAQALTDKIILSIENGTAPWLTPWSSPLLPPENGISGRRYHGANVMTLLTSEYQDPRWATFNQAKKKGWHVRKGEKASTIFFYSTRDVTTVNENGDEEIEKRPFMTSAKVFNFSQIEGAPEFEFTAEPSMKGMVSEEARDAFDTIMENSGANIVHGFRIAAYAPSEDKIYMPKREQFDSDAHYMTTALHELCHWTGAEHRLNRVFGSARNTTEYAMEELKAELGAVFLCSKLGIPFHLEDHSNYISSHLDILNRDSRAIWKAAKEAEIMCDYVLSLHPQYRQDIELEREQNKKDALASGAPADIFDIDDLDLSAPEFAPTAPAP